jgi:hypothetical protein
MVGLLAALPRHGAASAGGGKSGAADGGSRRAPPSLRAARVESKARAAASWRSSVPMGSVLVI